MGLRDIQNQRSAITLYDPLNRFTPRPRQPAAPIPRPAARPDDKQFQAQLAELAQVEQQQQQEGGDDGGIGGMFGRGLGILINNPITRTVTRPLDVLDVPRRAVWSTAKEVKDAFTDEDASFQDWYDQVNPLHAITGKGDVTIGAGTVIPDIDTPLSDGWDKWINRGVGLAGDIAGDPLTYVAGLGFVADAGPAAGRAGRALSATKAADKLRELGRVDELGKLLPGDLGQIQRITQRGYHEASDEFLDMMGVGGGVRFGVPFTKAETKGVLPGVTKQTSRVRAGLRDLVDKTPIGNRWQGKMLEKTAPKELKDAYARVFRGEGRLDTETALEMVAGDMARREGQGYMAGLFGPRVDKIVRRSRQLTDTEREDVLRQLETPGVVPKGFAADVQQLFDEMWQVADKAGVELGRRENYSPHILTRDAIQWLRSSGDNMDVQRLRGLVTEDLFAPSGVTMHRKFKPGEVIELNGKLIRLDDATIPELNQVFKEATGKNFNLYETDPGDIIEKYINMLSSDVGTAFLAQRRGGASRFVRENPLLGDGQRAVGTRVGEDGAEEIVSNVGPQRIRPDYVPGQNASRVSEALPPGVEGPALYGRSDLETIGQRVGADLDPQLFNVTRNTAETQALNTGITGSLAREQQRLGREKDAWLFELEYTINELPKAPAQRAARWSEVSKKLAAAKNRLLKERDKMVRMDGGWVLESEAPVRRLQAERAEKVGELARRNEIADGLEQSIANIEAGVRMYDQVLDDVARDVQMMDQAADRAAARQLRDHMTKLSTERDDLRRELNRIIERQKTIPRPWQDDPSLVARREAISTERAGSAEVIARLKQYHAEQAGVPIQQRELDRLKAARATQTAPTQEVKDARDFLATTPDIAKYDAALDTVARAEAVSEVPTPQRVGAARRYLSSEKGEGVRLHREHPGAYPKAPPAKDIERYDAAVRTIAADEAAKAAPTPAELKEARRFLRSRRGREIEEAKRIVETGGSQPSRTISSLDGRIKATEKRLAAAQAKAKRSLEADDAYRAAKTRAAAAERRAAGSSTEVPTPNIKPTPPDVVPTVRGVPITEYGDISNPRLKEKLGVQPGQEGLIPGGTAARDVAQGTRRYMDEVIAPGEEDAVRAAITRGREDAKSVIRQDTKRADELMDDINAVNRALVTVITDEATRNNLRDLFRASFMGGPQGEARQQAQDAFDGLLSDYMTRQAGEGAQAGIARLRDRIAALRQDVNTFAETVPPAVGSTEASLARQAEQGAATAPRTVTNLPPRRAGRKPNSPTKGYRTIDEIDTDLAAARQKQMDDVSNRATRQAQLEEGQAKAKAKVSEAQAVQRHANKAYAEGQRIVNEIKDPALRREAQGYADELADLASQAEQMGDDITANLLRRAIDDLSNADAARMGEAKVAQMLKDGRAGKLGRVVDIELADGLSILESSVLGDKWLIHDDLRKAFQYVREAQYDKNFWPVVDGFTNFFKTYATLTPGFHLRNGMSAVFNNTADGVPISDQAEGLNLYRSFLRSAKKGEQLTWMADPKLGGMVLNEDTGLTLADALTAAFGSGIGGRYRERGFADRASVRGKATEWIFNNKAVNLSKRAGGVVEGGVRLPVALDTIRRGGSVQDAMTRINRIHFDYSQISELDDKARRLIPFWTFTSRNLPLQLTQMWQKPRVYAWYDSFVRNFSGDAEPGTPEYFDAIGAFRFGDSTLGGLPLYLQPDLAHTRIREDLQRYEDALSGNPAQFLTDFNPMFTSPIEFVTGKDLFTGRTYDETDVRKTGALETPISMLAQGLGLGKETPSGDFATEERFLNFMRSMIPVYDRSLRLAPGITGGEGAAEQQNRQAESILRTLGVPVRQLSPQQQQATLRGQRFDARDEQAMQRALAALDR